ncbi:MAG TPA: DUF4097 family beta strand repeat-containing protein [Acidimicrobiia bacterium]|nr:DUF4097 family beta strand repeat-containing protein [Acidimicrobiia bacterium]
MIEKTFSVDGSPDVEIRVESGRVEVRRGKPGTVNVTVDTKSPDFIVEQRGNSILVSSDKTTPWLSRGSAYVVVETPEGSDLRVAVASAPIRVDVPLGKVDLKTASGDIELTEAETLVVKTASGDLDVANIDHALRFTSASGDLRVRDHCRGSVVVSTASGDIYIEHCDATINVNTASGDSRIARFTGRSASLKGMSGSVTIGIPRQSEVSLDVNLLSGKLRLPDPEPRQGEPERQVSVQAKLVSGNLTIERI